LRRISTGSLRSLHVRLRSHERLFQHPLAGFQRFAALSIHECVTVQASGAENALQGGLDIKAGKTQRDADGFGLRTQRNDIQTRIFGDRGG
jgi:hypothetical protein